MSRSELKQILRATEETLGRTEAVLEATTFRLQADLVEARREIEVAVKFCNLLQTGSEKIRKDLIQKHYRHVRILCPLWGLVWSRRRKR